MRRLIAMLILVSGAAVAAPGIKAPPTAKVGSLLALEATGSGNGHDFVTVVKKGAAEGSYDQYVYVAPGKLQLQRRSRCACSAAKWIPARATSTCPWVRSIPPP